MTLYSSKYSLTFSELSNRPVISSNSITIIIIGLKVILLTFCQNVSVMTGY